MTLIPEWFGELKSLRYLDINNNKLDSIPSSLQNLESLKTLDLSGNNKEEILQKSQKIIETLRNQGCQVIL